MRRVSVLSSIKPYEDTNAVLDFEGKPLKHQEKIVDNISELKENIM